MKHIMNTDYVSEEKRFYRNGEPVPSLEDFKRDKAYAEYAMLLLDTPKKKWFKFEENIPKN